MDYKKEVIDKLRCYTSKRESLRWSAEEIRRLEYERDSIRSASSDGTPVSGGTNAREDRLINNVAMRMEIEDSQRRVRDWLHVMDGVLSQLDQEEFRILDLMYIHSAKGNVDRLCGELGIEKNTVYYRKDKALRHFAIILYGEESNH